MIRKRTVPAVGYIRMSTDRQEDSPARQKAEIKQLAGREGYKISEWYEDHGLTGTESANRPEFQRLLRNAHAGKFEAILVHEQSRFSRENIFEVMLHWRLLRIAGVSIVTSRRGKMNFDDLGGLITAIIDAHDAREESVKIANRVVGGQRLKLDQGQRVIGGAVFGYDRVIRDEAGKIVRRVHYQERFKTPATWTAELAVSKDTATVDAIRHGMQMIKQGHPWNAVATEWNNRGLTSTFGNQFTGAVVKGTLTNPVYIGASRHGLYGRGKFRRLCENGVETCYDTHEPIVDRKLFEEVQKLAEQTGPYTPPRPGAYLLSTLVLCASCGGKYYGRQAVPNRKGSPHEKEREYSPCSNKKRPCCRTIQADGLESFVMKMVVENLLTNENLDRLETAVVRRRRQPETVDFSAEEQKLEEVRGNIAKGTRKLALCDEADIPGISKLLAEWREEAAGLEKEIRSKRGAPKADPEAAKVIARLRRYRGRLKEAERVTLAQALRQTVKRVTIGWKTVGNEKFHYREVFGSIEFHEGLGHDEPIPIPHLAIGRRRRWDDVADFVEKADRVLGFGEIQHAVHLAPNQAWTYLNQAIIAGRIRKSASPQGYVAVQ